MRVLFVCTGNICRSPTAEAIARQRAAELGLAGRVEFDSAGTHGYHLGAQPDSRSREYALRRGYDLSGLRARRLAVEDFARFDLLLAMDRGHLEQMRRLCPPSQQGRLGLFMSHATDPLTEEVPDPYYGEGEGFETVLDYCEQGVEGLLRQLADDPH